MCEYLSLDVTDGIALITLGRPPIDALEDDAGADPDGRTPGARAGRRRGGGDHRRRTGLRGRHGHQGGAGEVLRADAHRGGIAPVGVRRGRRDPQPPATAVTGAALGGGMELAHCCDRRIADEKAKLGQPEILLRSISGAGGTQRLARLVGQAIAKDLCLTGRTLSAAQALELRTLEEVMPSGQATAWELEWVRQFIGCPRFAGRAAKEAMDRGNEVDLPTGLRVERAIDMRPFIGNTPGAARFVGR